MITTRKPNTTCTECSKPIYVRPGQLSKHNGFCNRECRNLYWGFKRPKKCLNCGATYFPKHNPKTSKYCSRTCSNKSRKGAKYSKDANSNTSRKRLYILRKAFNFTSCMIQGCNYSKTFDIHRLVEGKDGGEYKVGNMFAICPNHHAEIHRNIIKVKKINNYTLMEAQSDGRRNPV